MVCRVRAGPFRGRRRNARTRCGQPGVGGKRTTKGAIMYRITERANWCIPMLLFACLLYGAVVAEPLVKEWHQYVGIAQCPPLDRGNRLRVPDRRRAAVSAFRYGGLSMRFANTKGLRMCLCGYERVSSCLFAGVPHSGTRRRLEAGDEVKRYRRFGRSIECVPRHRWNGAHADGRHVWDTTLSEA